MMDRECKDLYLDGIMIDNTAPFKISAISNYNVGWKDPVCIICQNKNEKVDV